MFKNRRFRLLCIIAASAAVIIMGVFLFFGIKTQRSAASELETVRQERQEQLDKLKLEYENIEARIEYVKSDEFLMRYAREHWGYMNEGDIRFDLNNPKLPEPGTQDEPQEPPSPESPDEPNNTAETDNAG